jgi:hypothetical protein
MLYIKFMKLREVNQQNFQRLALYETERSRHIEGINSLKNELVESQLQLEKISDNKLIHLLTGQKHSYDKFGLGFYKTNVSNIVLLLRLSL